MALTKSQRSLLQMDPAITSKHYNLFKQAAGMLILLTVSYGLGEFTLLEYLPVSEWLSELRHEMKWAIVFFPLVFCVGAFIIMHIAGAVVAILIFYDIVDVSENSLVRVFCSGLFLVPFALYFIENGGGPTMGPIMYACCLYFILKYVDRAVFVKIGLQAAYDKRAAQEFKNIETAIHAIKNPSDLIAIALEINNSRIARVAIDCIDGDHDLAAVVLKTDSIDTGHAAIDKILDTAIILSFAENADSVGIRQYACGKLGHVIDDPSHCCSRCGATPDERIHDWAGNICRRCGTEKHMKTSATEGAWVNRASIDEWHWDTHDGIEQVFVPTEYEVFVYRSKAERDYATSERS